MPKNLYINNGKVGNVYWNGAKVKKVFFNNVLVYSGALEFTYTGAYTVEGSLDGNFVVRFQTSGTLTITDHGDTGGLYDLFSVGGGGAGNYWSASTRAGGGGGGGYTKTVKNLAISVGVGVSIIVGAGGAVVNSSTQAQGGTSSVLTCSAPGGYGGASQSEGSDGGSGGGSYFEEADPSYGGGSNGSDGKGEYSSGKGQGTTTAEFGESGNPLYAGGGGGGSRYSNVNGSIGGAGGGGNGAMEGRGVRPGSPGVVNTGGGGGGSSSGITWLEQKAIGGSGIVCIRNHR